jgi:hypothetical protein
VLAEPEPEPQHVQRVRGSLDDLRQLLHPGHVMLGATHAGGLLGGEQLGAALRAGHDQLADGPIPRVVAVFDQAPPLEDGEKP